MRILFLLLLGLSVTPAFGNEEVDLPVTVTSISTVSDGSAPFDRVRISAQTTEPAKGRPPAFKSLVLEAGNGAVEVPDSVLRRYPSPQLAAIACSQGVNKRGEYYLNVRFLFGSPDEKGRFPRGFIGVKDGKVWTSYRLNPDGTSESMGTAP